jgi:autotransporter translocation and assembly factor TamB
VRLSSVEVRLLPRPGFVLTDLTVEEDPAYGAEPVLHANTVTASIRLLSLWRGRLEIDTISVDEASLNLVRTSAGRWNLDPLLRTATAHAQTAAAQAPVPGPSSCPTLRPPTPASTSRTARKSCRFQCSTPRSRWAAGVRASGASGCAASPFAPTSASNRPTPGIVRLEADLHQAPATAPDAGAPVDLEWRQAQLGQLTRLLLGSDAGWRGDLTGELQLDGTAEAAQIKARLRATGVHRAEFAPAEPMDFDANCSFAAHITSRAIDNLVCDSPLGDGHVRLTGNLPGERAGQGGLPRLSVELDRISAAVGLDALRTVRSDLAPGLEASGSASGKITYAPSAANPASSTNATGR